MSLPNEVSLFEVGARDGLQNEAKLVPTEIKVELINRLARTGLSKVEAGSFVSPKAIPKMADTADVFQRIKRRPGVRYPALTPNKRGFLGAHAAGADEIGVFASATETFSQRNINCSIAESLDRFLPVMEAAREAGLPVRGYVSCVLGCPFEGEVAVEQAAAVARELFQMGCYEISLGDTIGTGTATKTQNLLEACALSVPIEKLAGHYHDTYGQALANILASLEVGVSIFDSSIAGLGGCPYAPGATGNVATEDVVFMLDGMGLETGVDLQQLVDVAWFISDFLGRPPVSRVANAIAAKRKFPA